MTGKLLLTLLIACFFTSAAFSQINITEVTDSLLNEVEINGVTVNSDGETILFGGKHVITYTDEVVEDYVCELCYEVVEVASYLDTQYIGNYFGGLFKRFGDSIAFVADYEAFSMVFDKNGVLYGIDSYNGIFRWNGSSGQSWNEDNSNLPTDYVYDIAIDSNGLLWLATHDGLVSFNGNTFSIKSVPDELSSTFYEVIVDANNAVWVSSAYGGVGRFANNSWTTFPQTFGIFQLVQGLGVLHGDEIFTSSFEEGLYRYVNNQFINYSPAQLGYAELGNNSFISGDAQGRLWMKFDHTPLLYLTTETTSTVGIQNESMLSIYPNPSSGIVHFSLATNNSGIREIYILGMDGRICYHKTFDPKQTVTITQPDLAPGLYQAIVVDAKGNRMMDQVVILSRK